MAIKSVVFLLGMLVVCGLVQGQSPDSDSTVGSTDPMTDALSFKFADEDSSTGAPADVEANSSVPEGESFWSDNESFTEAQDYIPADGTDVIFNDAGNATNPDDDGFDMVEDVDNDSTAAQ